MTARKPLFRCLLLLVLCKNVPYVPARDTPQHSINPWSYSSLSQCCQLNRSQFSEMPFDKSPNLVFHQPIYQQQNVIVYDSSISVLLGNWSKNVKARRVKVKPTAPGAPQFQTCHIWSLSTQTIWWSHFKNYEVWTLLFRRAFPTFLSFP